MIIKPAVQWVEKAAESRHRTVPAFPIPPAGQNCILCQSFDDCHFHIAPADTDLNIIRHFCDN